MIGPDGFDYGKDWTKATVRGESVQAWHGDRWLYINEIPVGEPLNPDGHYRRPMAQAEKDAEAGKATEKPEGKISIGGFTISDGFAEGAIWINRQSGEGGSFNLKAFEAHIEEFYQKHF